MVKKNITKLRLNQGPIELSDGHEWVIVNDIESDNMIPIQELLVDKFGYKWPSNWRVTRRRKRLDYIVHSFSFGNVNKEILFGDQNLHKYESNGVRIFKASELI